MAIPFQKWNTISKLAIPIQNLNFNPICINYTRNVSARMVHDPAWRPARHDGRRDMARRPATRHGTAAGHDGRRDVARHGNNSQEKDKRLTIVRKCPKRKVISITLKITSCGLKRLQSCLAELFFPMHNGLRNKLISLEKYRPT